MKVFEVLDTDWENVSAVPKDGNWEQMTKIRHDMRNRRYRALAHEDTMIMWRLDAIVNKYPKDIQVRAQPDENDQSDDLDWTKDIEDPLEYQTNPNDWEMMTSPGAWFYDGMMQDGEEYEPHEKFFVRKTFPFLSQVTAIIDRHINITTLRGNLWRYPE